MSFLLRDIIINSSKSTQRKTKRRHQTLRKSPPRPSNNLRDKLRRESKEEGVGDKSNGVDVVRHQLELLLSLFLRERTRVVDLLRHGVTARDGNNGSGEKYTGEGVHKEAMRSLDRPSGVSQEPKLHGDRDGVAEKVNVGSQPGTKGKNSTSNGRPFQEVAAGITRGELHCCCCCLWFSKGFWFFGF